MVMVDSDDDSPAISQASCIIRFLLIGSSHTSLVQMTSEFLLFQQLFNPHNENNKLTPKGVASSLESERPERVARTFIFDQFGLDLSIILFDSDSISLLQSDFGVGCGMTGCVCVFWTQKYLFARAMGGVVLHF